MTKRPPTPAPTTDTKRCAIYTRKSTTMGLEQEFNSLDAQRESALAYIQRQPGWKLVDERYDDGGFTGANIDRPAFTRLLADVEAGKIDVIGSPRMMRSRWLRRSARAKSPRVSSRVLFMCPSPCTQRKGLVRSCSPSAR